MHRVIPAAILMTVMVCVATGPAEEKENRVNEPEIAMSLPIARVPAGFPVGFCLLTAGERQYAAYYDEERRMTVACRALDAEEWQYQTLPTEVGWDSHNSIAMAADDDGCLHLSGNMHNVPLIYFRTSQPWDIATFEKIESMTGENEQSCTYPQFMRGANSELIFHYRDGGSGHGNEIYNVYDTKTKTWKRLLDTPLTDGKDLMNAYMHGPLKGPDGRFHLCWVWRDTPDCQTNHDPSYARSSDLIHWETIDGKPVTLPITLETSGVLIDNVTTQGGIINGCLRIGFDSAAQALASYHKFDENGNTQAYVARFEDGRWIPRQVSDWDYRWSFEGWGSIIFEIRLGAVRPHDEGRLALPFTHVKYGDGLLILDEKTLEPLGVEAKPPRYPAGLWKLESAYEGMEVRWAEDMGEDNDPASRYVLRWETLPQHRDRPREGELPEPAMLRLYKLTAP
ncbi:BNR repeat-containing protein [Candidatus Sumerlaeota bacterium]|nr:BNR repeat-containing protein [Candidatus Sumerlaeota bacterium]